MALVTVRLQVAPSAIQSANHILSLSESNGELEIQTTPDAYDPYLPIQLEKKIDLRLSGDQATSVKVKRILSRVVSVWWVVILGGLLIFDLYYGPLFQQRASLLLPPAMEVNEKPKSNTIANAKWIFVFNEAE